MRGLALLVLLAGCGDTDWYAPYNEAHAALREGEIRKAADALAGAGDDIRVTFLRGNVAFARCVQAERQAAQPGAEPFAWDVALKYGLAARDAWATAAMSRDDWPAARRNVERALRKLVELRQKKTEAERKRDGEKKPEPKPEPKPKPPPPDPQPKADEPDDPETIDIKELSREEVVRLLDKLAEKEREKRALRRETRKTRTKGVAKDW